jgi:predicted transcriptional regulator
MSRKRSNLEISADILKVAIGGAKKSHLVYQANLNFAIIKEYLKNLSSSGLLATPANGSKLYTTTDKGIAFVKYVNGLQQFAMN